MIFNKRFLTIAFAMFMLIGGLAVEASAQRRIVVVQQPVAVRRVYVRPSYGYYPYRRFYGYSDPFYRSFYQSPYERYLEERFYARRELAGNRRELEKHRAKYRADGYISPKEQRELEDDVRDVQRSLQRLSRLNRSY